MIYPPPDDFDGDHEGPLEGSSTFLRYQYDDNEPDEDVDECEEDNYGRYLPSNDQQHDHLYYEDEPYQYPLPPDDDPYSQYDLEEDRDHDQYCNEEYYDPYEIGLENYSPQPISSTATGMYTTPPPPIQSSKYLKGKTSTDSQHIDLL